MHELLNILAQVGVYPALVLLWVKMDAAQRAHTEVLHYLEKNCPHCGAVRVITR